MATSRNMTDAPWQSNKTVNECNKYMLENELYSDVTFLVGDEDTGVKEIKAHRYILVSRSPVFEAMLCGDLREKGTIKIPDTDIKTFQCFLRYLYYEEFQEDPSTFLPLLYLANKYIIPALEHTCEEKLKDNINIENVCLILEQSLLYEKQDLTNDSMAFIRTEAKDIVKQRAFLALNQQTLKFILKDDKLFISEPEVFESCISWGKNQCDVAGKPQTGENMRNVIGEALYCIRFPTMPAKHLADRVAPMEIVSEGEMLNLLICAAGSNEENRTRFISKQRVGFHEILVCDRCQCSEANWGHGGPPDAIAFKTDTDIVFHGIKVFPSDDVNAKHSAEVKLYQGEICLGSVSCEVSWGLQQKEIKLTDPVLLLKDILYDVVLTMKGPGAFQGVEGKGVVTSHGVMFNFSKSNMDKNSTSVSDGQIPGILFSTPI